MTDASAANENAKGGCFYAKPTFVQKFWRALGWRYHLGNEPPDADLLQGWSRTDIRFSFGWLDRIRLLFTGRLKVSVTSQFDAPSPSTIKNRTDFRIVEPFGDWE
jgi:hypothetical protein